MPYYEYRCESCEHEEEKFFRSITEGEKYQVIVCGECGHPSRRVPSIPFPAHFYGDPAGYHKPSALKRHSTKLASAEGNDKT